MQGRWTSWFRAARQPDCGRASRVRRDWRRAGIMSCSCGRVRAASPTSWVFAQGLFDLRTDEKGELVASRAATGELIMDAAGHPVKDETVSLHLTDLRARVSRAVVSEREAASEALGIAPAGRGAGRLPADCFRHLLPRTITFCISRDAALRLFRFRRSSTSPPCPDRTVFFFVSAAGPDKLANGDSFAAVLSEIRLAGRHLERDRHFRPALRLRRSLSLPTLRRTPRTWK